MPKSELQSHVLFFSSWAEHKGNIFCSVGVCLFVWFLVVLLGFVLFCFWWGQTFIQILLENLGFLPGSSKYSCDFTQRVLLAKMPSVTFLSWGWVLRLEYSPCDFQPEIPAFITEYIVSLSNSSPTRVQKYPFYNSYLINQLLKIFFFHFTSRYSKSFSKTRCTQRF